MFRDHEPIGKEERENDSHVTAITEGRIRLWGEEIWTSGYVELEREKTYIRYVGRW